MLWLHSSSSDEQNDSYDDKNEPEKERVAIKWDTPQTARRASGDRALIRYLRETDETVQDQEYTEDNEHEP